MYRFLFQNINDIVLFNSNSMTLPDEGNIQFLPVFHPQFVHLVEVYNCWKEHLQCLQTFITKSNMCIRLIGTYQRETTCQLQA
jgi:hypothetical protein